MARPNPPEQIMDEHVGSCLICGKLRKLAVVHAPSGVGVCKPCYDRATGATE